MSTLKPEQLDALLQGYKTPAELESLYSQLLQRMINRGLEAEMDAHLGYGHGERSEASNSRNGKSRKRVQSNHGELEVTTPRDRAGEFEPQLVKKRQLRLGGMEDKILTLYAKGMTTRDISDALVDLYGVEVSHSVVARVTDALLDEARTWQNRPLDAIYPIVWLDGIVVKVIWPAIHGHRFRNSSALRTQTG